MGDFRTELAGSNRIARPAEFTSDGVPRYVHPAVTAEVLAGQHSIRAWEYTQALNALNRWYAGLPGMPTPLKIADVGGAGSNFYKTLGGPEHAPVGCLIAVIDPSLQTPDGQPGLVHTPDVTLVKHTLADWATPPCPEYDVVFCLSVLEHVPQGEVPIFLEQLRSLVRPGGLLFLTCDCAPSSPDVFHFHWMRAGWCPTPSFMAGLESSMAAAGFRHPAAKPDEHLGDWEYRGATVYDYSAASIACVRRTEG